jgi:hypothetical protein
LTGDPRGENREGMLGRATRRIGAAARRAPTDFSMNDTQASANVPHVAGSAIGNG